MENIRPTPPHAIALWFEGDSIVFQAPASFGEPAIHLSLPIDKCGIETNDSAIFPVPLPSQRGWHVILQVLRERYNNRQDRKQRTIGTPSSPCERTIEEMIKAHPITVVSKRKARPELTLEDLEL